MVRRMAEKFLRASQNQPTMSGAMFASLRNALLRSRIRWADAVRYSRLMPLMVSVLTGIRASLTADKARRLELFLKAYRFADVPLWEKIIYRGIRAWLDPNTSGRWLELQVGWKSYQPAPRHNTVDRTVVLKEPSTDGEKGVILLTFEYNWLKLLEGIRDFRWLDEHFDFILSTSWSPSDYGVLGLALSRIRGTIFVQACNYGEIARFERFSPRVKCLRTLPCDWINPAFYRPKPHTQRATDILVVANWAPFKRHWQLFEALRSLPRHLRVTLIGQPEGEHTLEGVRRLATFFSVKQDLEFLQSVPIDEVTRRQCDSKISLILSRREGCCVAAVEALFADAPLGMMHDAHVGPRAYINEHTGRMLRPGGLAYQLEEFLERAASYQPRAWAMRHVSCYQSIERLNALLKEHATSSGQPWTQNATMPCWRPHPTLNYSADAERMRPVYAELHERYPGVFGPDLLQTSFR